MTSYLALLAVFSLATFRLSAMVAGEIGPFEAFNVVSEGAKRRFGGGHWIYIGLNCPKCLSFWFGLFFAAGPMLAAPSPFADSVPGFYALYFVTALALSGVTCLLLHLGGET